MNRLPSLLSALALSLSAGLCAADEQALKAYPAAENGMQRYVIELEALENEGDAQVELIAGKTLEIDCNRHMLGGQWEEQVVEGWGYTYYQLESVGPAVSTLMACPDSSKQEAFVAVGGDPMLVRYNSKLPLVVYTPSDIELRYRIWHAGETHIAKP